MRTTIATAIVFAVSAGCSGPTADCGMAGTNTHQNADGSCGCDDGYESRDGKTCVLLPRQVPAFTGELLYVGHTESDVVVELPAADADPIQQIIMHYELVCPPAGCDPYDRDAWVKVIQDPGTPQETGIEVWRLITPFCVGGKWDLDVTHLLPLLTGSQTIRVHIGTGVGPNDNYPQDGWKLNLSFEYRYGEPAEKPIAVIPLWDVISAEYGNPNVPIAQSVPLRMVNIPPGVSHAKLWAFVTGHGQGNAENCGEFCDKLQTISVNGIAFDKSIARSDCAQTAVPGQCGTYTYPREGGWCPGAEVYPWSEDVSAAITPGQAIPITYDVEGYVNTCRPDAPGAPSCTGCTLLEYRSCQATNTCCEYDGGAHTLPRWMVSAALILYP
jgi:hypothetical protein